MAKIFEYQVYPDKQGRPLHWLKESIKRNIMRDPKLYVLNRMLRSWGFARVKVAHGKWISAGRCPFTKKDSTVERFKQFLMNFPEFSEFVSMQATQTVIQRKKVIAACQRK